MSNKNREPSKCVLNAGPVAPVTISADDSGDIWMPASLRPCWWPICHGFSVRKGQKGGQKGISPIFGCQRPGLSEPVSMAAADL